MSLSNYQSSNKCFCHSPNSKGQTLDAVSNEEHWTCLTFDSKYFNITAATFSLIVELCSSMAIVHIQIAWQIDDHLHTLQNSIQLKYLLPRRRMKCKHKLSSEADPTSHPNSYTSTFYKNSGWKTPLPFFRSGTIGNWLVSNQITEFHIAIHVWNAHLWTHRLSQSVPSTKILPKRQGAKRRQPALAPAPAATPTHISPKAQT